MRTHRFLSETGLAGQFAPEGQFARLRAAGFRDIFRKLWGVAMAKIAVVLALGVTIAIGWYQLYSFSSTAGQQSGAPLQIPTQAVHEPIGRLKSVSLPRSSAVPTLLVFIHPQCSCTHATLQQLDLILDSVQVPVEVEFAMYESAKMAAASREQMVLRGASAFTPAEFFRHPFRLIADPSGALARRFGAATSGEVLLYSTDGRLLFQGGVTPFRSETGDSPASRALSAALKASTSARVLSRLETRPFQVFGCPLFGDNRTVRGTTSLKARQEPPA